MTEPTKTAATASRKRSDALKRVRFSAEALAEVHRMQDYMRNEVAQLKAECAQYQAALGVEACVRCGAGDGFGAALDLNGTCERCGVAADSESDGDWSDDDDLAA